MVRRVIQATTTAAVMFAAASLPAAALKSSPEASVSAYKQPAIADVYSYEGAYQCGSGCAPDGGSSSNSLMLASDGNYYGATNIGGSFSYGTLFKLTPSGTYTDIHNFGFTPDGATVVTSLMEASDGNLYGVTDAGGGHYNGTIFQYNLSTGVLTTVYSFANGGDSYSQLLDDGKGNLYGTTSYDGVNGLGNIFSWNYKTNTYTDVFDFANGPEGQHPWAGIVIASDGRIYGTSRFGGPTDHTGTGFGDGVAWSVKTDGTDLKVIHDFGANSADGYSPVQGFVEGPDGALFSTTLYGGTDCSSIGSTNGCGTFYKITLNRGEAAYTQLQALSLSSAQGVGPQRGSPTLGGDGNIYVVGPQGGPNDYGQLMAFTPEGAYTDVHDFGVIGAKDTSLSPVAAVIEDQLGNLWGGTTSGGEHEDGEIFKIEAGIAPAMTLKASTTASDFDQPVQLSWKVTNAFSTSAKLCFASSSDGSFSGLKSITGSATVTPLKSGVITYALTCGGSQTALATVTVAKAIVTTTTITSAPSKLIYGQGGTVVASVISPSGKVSGKIEVIAGGEVLGSASVSNGIVRIPFATTKLRPGSYNLQAKYEGDDEYSDSVSAPASLTVTKILPIVAFLVSPIKVADGAPAVLIVSVTNGIGTPTGSVDFSIAGQTIASASLTSGSAIVSMDTSKYKAGTYAITATYESDTYDTHAAATETLTIDKDTTVTTLSTASSIVAGKPLVATITVTKPNIPGTPTGSVQLLKNGSVIGKAALSNGKAVITGSAGLPAGTYTLQAIYLGDAESATSSSSSKSVTVTNK